MMLKSTVLFLSFFLLENVCANDTKLKVNMSSGNIEYLLSKNLPKGDYKIWNLTKDVEVGQEIYKKASTETTGMMLLSSHSLYDNFALLNQDGIEVYKLINTVPKPTVSVPAVLTIKESEKRVLPEVSNAPTMLIEETSAENNPTEEIDTI